MFEWFNSKWNASNRQLDISILWPVCKECASTLEDARFAFLVHCSHDESWTCLSRDEIVNIVKGLK